MNNSLRNALSWANEVGLLASLLVAIGYFGSRQLLGILPGVALILYLVAGMGLLIMYAGQKGEDDSYSESPKFDKVLWMAVCFVGGTALFTLIGSLL